MKSCPKKLLRIFVSPSILKRSMQRQPFPSVAQVVKFSKQIENYIPWLKSISIWPGDQIKSEYITLRYSQWFVYNNIIKMFFKDSDNFFGLKWFFRTRTIFSDWDDFFRMRWFFQNETIFSEWDDFFGLRQFFWT